MGRSIVRQYRTPIINLPQLGKWSQASTQSALVGTAGNMLELVPNCSISTIGQITSILNTITLL